MIAALPAECDLPGMSCGANGGSWLPLIIGAVGFAFYLGYRFGRFGGGRR